MKKSIENKNDGNGNKKLYPKQLTFEISKRSSTTLIGRQWDLLELINIMKGSEKVVVSGLGGIGKTALVGAYVGHTWNQYKHIAWLTQNDYHDFTNDISQATVFLKRLSIVPEGDSKNLFKQAMARLQEFTNKPNLLVIDNASLSIEKYLKWLPKAPEWHVLLTSRHEIKGCEIKRLGLLAKSDSLDLFHKYYKIGKFKQSELLSLLQTIDYHTLSIEILAKTAQKQRYNLTILKQALEKDIRARVSTKHSEGQLENIASYICNIFKRSLLNPSELWLLQQFICFPYSYHEFKVIESLIGGGNTKDDCSIAEILNNLQEKGWLLYDRERDRYKMHKVVQLVICMENKPSYDEVKELLGKLNSNLVFDSKVNPVEKFCWMGFGDIFLELFGTETDEQIAELYNNMGRMLIEMGNYHKSAQLLNKAVVLANEGVMPAKVTLYYNNLAKANQLLGEYETAKILLEKAIEFDEMGSGKNYTSLSRSYSNLALVLQDFGEYEQAKVYLEKALDFDEKYLGKQHLETAKKYSNLALVFQNLGDYEAAKQLLTDSIDYFEVACGKEHPKTASLYSNLSMVNSYLGAHETSRKLLLKAINIDKLNFGDQHPETAKKYFNLATVLNDLGKIEDSYVYIQRAQEIFKAVLPLTHPYVLKVNEKKLDIELKRTIHNNEVSE